MCLNYQNDQLSSNEIQCNPKEKHIENLLCVTKIVNIMIRKKLQVKGTYTWGQVWEILEYICF